MHHMQVVLYFQIDLCQNILSPTFFLTGDAVVSCNCIIQKQFCCLNEYFTFISKDHSPFLGQSFVLLVIMLHWIILHDCWVVDRLCMKKASKQYLHLKELK